jgi:hypothetical protein
MHNIAILVLFIVVSASLDHLRVGLGQLLVDATSQP